VELTWSTFLLEIVNFLVLVWLLKRFLYRPVLEVIERRRAGVQKTLADARRTHDEAEALQEQYENRLAEWEREKQNARTALAAEIDTDRTRLKEALAATLEEERTRARVLEERRLAEEKRRGEAAALEQAGRFGARLFSRVAGAEVESRLLEMALEDLAALPADRIEALRAASDGANGALTVTTAWPVDPGLRENIQRMLRAALERPALNARFERDPDLLAGARIALGPWVLRANLRDELAFFTDAAIAGGTGSAGGAGGTEGTGGAGNTGGAPDTGDPADRNSGG